MYAYVLAPNKSKAEKYLNLRNFSDKEKSEVYSKQKGICPICKDKFSIDDMQADHKIPWSKGGKTTKDNCQMLCRDCNQIKSGK